MTAPKTRAETALDAECRRIGEARAAGFLTGAEAGMLAALACLLHDLGVVDRLEVPE